ncbi:MULTISPECIES: DinB family protein [Bacillus cereus group]|uniref:DinB family protein n=1 Tax=Bacillus cereus group TaxID=86661 RepID=UPI0002790E73|nr:MULTISPECIES: DinB family protein [Bacillus cereus group]EJQ15254.1 hypothetical protein IE5_05571 [Bacillus cereus BAG3X2-2]MBE5091010.1 DinB family protein [Bacillus thuringiensis]MDF3554602.1 DinB family protein [Bacillus cereus]NIL29341.1 DUF664 domain-containing protein [Bacillus thuringiensis]NRQ72220.1 DinB family protein [Bacillus cereus]
MNDTLDLFRYHVWANKRVFDHLKKLPDDLYRRPLKSVFPTISDALAHIYSVDNTWISIMSHESPEDIYAAMTSSREEVNDATLDAFEAYYDKIAARYEEFILNHQSDLETISEYPLKFGVLRANYNDLIRHVVNHGTYHRGNITAMLRQMDYEGISTDYGFYLFELKR